MLLCTEQEHHVCLGSTPMDVIVTPQALEPVGLLNNSVDLLSTDTMRGRRARQAETANQRSAKDKEVSQVVTKFGGPSGSALSTLATAAFRQLWGVLSKVAAKIDADLSGSMALERLTSWFGGFAERQGKHWLFCL